MTIVDRLIFFIIFLIGIYTAWRFYQRYRVKKMLYDVYYGLGYLALLASSLVLMLAGFGFLSSPWILILVSLIPIALSLGLVRQYYAPFKRIYSWFCALGLVLLAVGAFMGTPLRLIAILGVHGVAGVVMFLVPLLAYRRGKAVRGIWWISVGVVLIALVDLPRSFLNAGRQLLFFSPQMIQDMLAPVLLLSVLAITWGFVKDVMATIDL
jgi:hypothetical protein